MFVFSNEIKHIYRAFSANKRLDLNCMNIECTKGIVNETKSFAIFHIIHHASQVLREACIQH